MNKNAGFTLIELLVVVLIIGILSAVALPQYTKAVEKSRATEAISLVRVIRDLQEAYFMANGVYASNLNELDIDIPGEDGFSSVQRRETKWFSFAGATGIEFAPGQVVAVGNRLPIGSYYAIIAVAGDSRLMCKYYTSAGEDVCKSFGGDKVSSVVYSIN